MDRILPALLLAGLAGVAQGQSITLERIQTIDFSGLIPTDSSVFSVAWDGSNAFVGTFSNLPLLQPGDIPQTQTLSVVKDDGSLIGGQGTNSFRGISSLAVQDGLLAVMQESNGGNNATGVQIFDTSTGNLVATSSIASTGRGGVAFDPINGGLAFGQFGSGRFRQVSTTDGSVVDPDGAGPQLPWDTANGPFNFDGAWGTAYDDIDIDADGNVYAREGTQVIKFTRTGPGQFQTPFGANNVLTPQFSASTGDNSVGQNLEVLNDFGVLLYNDRSDGSGGQAFADVISAITLDGIEIDLFFANSPTDFLNNGAYDFSYDEATQTLAISEFTSNRVYVYQVTPTPGAAGLLALAGLAASRRRR